MRLKTVAAVAFQKHHLGCLRCFGEQLGQGRGTRFDIGFEEVGIMRRNRRPSMIMGRHPGGSSPLTTLLVMSVPWKLTILIILVFFLVALRIIFQDSQED